MDFDKIIFSSAVFLISVMCLVAGILSIIGGGSLSLFGGIAFILIALFAILAGISILKGE